MKGMKKSVSAAAPDSVLPLERQQDRITGPSTELKKT